MDIIVGRIAEIGSPGQNEQAYHSPVSDIPVQLLALRPARPGEPGEENGAKVLVLMVPGGIGLPPDLERGKYLLRLRILPEKKEELREKKEEPKGKTFDPLLEEGLNLTA